MSCIFLCCLTQLPLGRQCVEHYRLLHRYCVFSHDEMICKMASKADVLDVVVASTVQKDMAIMIEDEKTLRETVRKLVRFLESQMNVIGYYLVKFLCTLIPFLKVFSFSNFL